MRTVLLPIAAAVALVPLAAAHAAPADRVLVFEYVGLTGVEHPRATVLVGCPPKVVVAGRPSQTCASFDTAAGERTLVLRAADDTGAPVGLQVLVAGRSAGTFCGAGSIALPAKAAPVSVRPIATTTGACTGTATRGTLTATLSRR